MTNWRSMGTGNGQAAAAAHNAPADRPAAQAPAAFYARVTRIVSYFFLIAALALVTLFGGADQASVYALLALGLFLTVLFQEILPPTVFGAWRVPLQAAVALVFLTVLLVFTGGRGSPYFFGYVLLLFAGALSASGWWPSVLTLSTAAAYVIGVLVAPDAGPVDRAALGAVVFNVIAFGLVAYVASAIGREQRHAREEALRLSRFDSLTGLPNRDYFQATVEQEILRATRSGRAFGLLMIDLDGLKAANDRFGHASGDQLLQAVADVLRGDTRATDLAARYAGDEFVLILPETDLPGALRVAEKVRVDVARLALPHEGALIRTSASIGLVTYPDDGRTSIELMRRADLAMYEAKRRGKDQIVRYARQVVVPMGAPGSGPSMAQAVPANSSAASHHPSVPARSALAEDAFAAHGAQLAPAAQPAPVPPESPGPPPWGGS